MKDKPKPLCVAISAVISEDKILLIKRERGDYIGLLGLPGGKVDFEENISQASIREIEEESGIKCDFVNFLGVVSEILVEDNKVIANLILNVCELKPLNLEITQLDGGKVNWYDLKDIEILKEKLIPSDYFMIKNMILSSSGKNYFDCIIEKKEDEHILKKFE